jgi:hypothetical protein
MTAAVAVATLHAEVVVRGATAPVRDTITTPAQRGGSVYLNTFRGVLSSFAAHFRLPPIGVVTRVYKLGFGLTLGATHVPSPVAADLRQPA